jgi:hypothetical protein
MPQFCANRSRGFHNSRCRARLSADSCDISHSKSAYALKISNVEIRSEAKPDKEFGGEQKCQRRYELRLDA